MLIKAINTKLRPLDSIADPAARAACSEAAFKFREMMEDEKVMRGTTGTHPDGAYSPETTNIHFDRPWLDEAVAGNIPLWDVAHAALHEAMHALGHEHGEPMGQPIGGVWIYGEQPFSHLNPGENTCIDFSD